MNLIIDIGNTRIKAAIFNGSDLIYDGIFETDPILSIAELLLAYPNINKAIVSSTGRGIPELNELIQEKVNTFILFNQKTPVSFSTVYETPESIGLDRLAAVAGAHNMFPKKNILIIDAGTAITYDIITQAGIHLGGNISPGLSMRAKALHEYTERLPLVPMNGETSLFGKNTFDAISNGIINGLVYEIESTILQSQSIYEDLTVLLTGGDAEFFEIKLKKTIFVVSNLVSKGLNIILNHNVENI